MVRRMEHVKVSPKFQVVIPKLVRESLGILPGQRLQVVQYGDRIELVPVRDIGEMRGFLAGMDTSFEREPDREL
jgi:AbrB family looped-hinge helix DNA binding protein